MMNRLFKLVLCASLALGSLVGCGAIAKHPEDGKSAAVFEDPDHDPYNFYRAVGYTLLRTRQYMKATQSIKRMVKAHPELPEPHYMMACAYLGMEQYDAARKLFLRAIERDEKYAPAHAQLGVLLNTLGRNRDADREHHKAIALDPSNAAYRNNLGFSQYMQGRLKEAVKTYVAALERDAAQKRIHNNLAFAYAKLGSLDKAFAHFKLAGPPAQATNNLGYVAEEQGHLERAYELYVQAVKQDPELIQAHRNLERVCLSLGRPLPDLGVESKPLVGTPPVDLTPPPPSPLQPEPPPPIPPTTEPAAR
jgi:Flp pilus assembly protein TadD